MSNLPMESLVYNAWYVAAWSVELADGPVSRRIMGEEVVIFRSGDGDVGAVEDRCSHRAARLSLGCPVRQGLMCGYHGMVFDTDGKCVENPGGEVNASFDIQSFPVVERQQTIRIWMGEAAAADESLIVDLPFHDMSDD